MIRTITMHTLFPIIFYHIIIYLYSSVKVNDIMDGERVVQMAMCLLNYSLQFTFLQRTEV